MGEPDPEPLSPVGGQPENVPAPRSAGDSRELMHELNNSLASIAAFSHLIRTDSALPDEMRRHAALLIEEVVRTRRIAAQILDVAPPVAAPESRSETRSGGPAARILIVDDEPAIREFLARALARHGYVPLTAVDGISALEIVEREPPDAIICDQRMLTMSGIDFHAAVVAGHPELAGRFAFMSGDIEDPELRAAAAVRGAALLGKPFDMTRMLRVFDELLAPDLPDD